MGNLRVCVEDLERCVGRFALVNPDSKKDKRIGIFLGFDSNRGYAYLLDPVYGSKYECVVDGGLKISTCSDYSMLDNNIKNSFTVIINKNWSKLNKDRFLKNPSKLEISRISSNDSEADIVVFQQLNGSRKTLRYILHISDDGLLINKDDNSKEDVDLRFIDNSEGYFEKFTSRDMSIVKKFLGILRCIENKRYVILTDNNVRYIVVGNDLYTSNATSIRKNYGIRNWYDVDIFGTYKEHLSISSLFNEGGCNTDVTFDCGTLEDDGTRLVQGVISLGVIEVGKWHPVKGLDLMYVGKFGSKDLEIVYVTRARAKSGKVLYYSIMSGRFKGSKIFYKRLLGAYFTIKEAMKSINAVIDKQESVLNERFLNSLVFDNKFKIYSIEDSENLVTIKYSLKNSNIKYTLEVIKRTLRIVPNSRPISVECKDLYMLMDKINMLYRSRGILLVG